MSKELFLITIDCLRKDAITQKDTPFLFELSKKGISYENFFANAPFTPASFPVIFCSKYPLDFETHTPLTDKEIYLPKILKKNQFYTIGLSSNVYLTKKFGYATGFDIFRDYLDENKQSYLPAIKKKFTEIFPENSRTYTLFSKLLLAKRYFFCKYEKPYPLGERLLNDAKKLMNENQNKFCWIHLMEAHNPYLPPKKYIEEYHIPFSKRQIAFLNAKAMQEPDKINDQELDILKKLYKACTRYIDDMIKNFYQSIIKKNPSAIFIITADHGEEFKEHGGLNHKSNLHKELLNIPLIIAGKNLPKKREKNLASSIDILPTILDIMKINYPNHKIKGHSLLKDTKRAHILAECRHKKNRMPAINENILHGKQNDKIYQIFSAFNEQYAVIFDELKGTFEFFNLKNNKEKTGLLETKDNFNKLKEVIIKRQKEIAGRKNMCKILNHIQI